MGESVKISKRSILIMGAIVLVLLAAIYYFVYYVPQQKMIADVEAYKKALYDSILCQYNCPLEDVVTMNQTQPNIQNRDCVLACIQQLKDKGYQKAQYPQEELEKDKIAEDVQKIVVGCQNEGMNNETRIADNKI